MAQEPDVLSTGPYASLITAFPDGAAWLAASPEDMGVVLLRELRHSDSLSLHNLLATLREHYARTWTDPAELQARLGAVAEAYQWLRTIGLIAPNPRQPDDFDMLTRSARALGEDGVRAYIAARTSCYELLDHRISDKVWGICLRGDHDIAVAYASRSWKFACARAGLAPSDYGERPVKKFFAKFDSEIPVDEKGMAHVVHLLIGAFDRYRNEAAHQDITMGRDEALELLLLANHCLRVVERARARKQD